ncbi:MULTISPECIES: 2'-5' RNA ligase family protein [unclassified Myroides]|uniref:2'-5' RNA ligase family protein n=1 Tax=unclassified Myroides TaxID=2642485 RepID=UPI003D2F80C5
MYSNKYSLCFQPDLALIEQVKVMKLQLGEVIGWYNSKNSLAHLTIAEFQASEQDIQRMHQQITRCCNGFTPVETHLSSFGTYPNGTFFLEVDALAKPQLKTYAQKLFQTLQLKNAYKCTDPHLSIARKLDDVKIQQAYALFEQPQLSFCCDLIVLRRLNMERRQFDCIHYYPFLSQPIEGETQLTLF